MRAIEEILAEDARRQRVAAAPFNPLSGEGSTGERFVLDLPDFVMTRQWLPEAMEGEPLVELLQREGSVACALRAMGETVNEANAATLGESLMRLRLRHDFAFWAATQVMIHPKEGGEARPFVLNRPQREKLIPALEAMRQAGKPIRLILLKARQWGGSTAIQLYMAWLQLVHCKGLNSVIVAQTKKTSFAIRAMYDRALESYPLELLHAPGETFDATEPRMVNVGMSSDYKLIPQRDCTITIASYEAPDALRGDAYSLVHCSEVGLWSPTDRKTPDSIVRSACSGILYKPLTMIVYESTANGTGNFFQREYAAAKAGVSQFEPLFVAWWEIEQYANELSDEERRALAERLLNGRQATAASTNREEPGAYLWSLWERGATLGAIDWYIKERSARDSHGVMAAEYPTDDVEAFVHSGAMVFDRMRCEALKRTCRPPRLIGELDAEGTQGAGALRSLRFNADSQGLLWVWQEPEIDEKIAVAERYLVVVDIGGRGSKADWSVITVFDRLFMEEGGKPGIAAQWRGHIDMDLLAWKAAQVAQWYDNALLVIESNTLETRDRSRSIEGDQSSFILNEIAGVYENLYARSVAGEDSVVEHAATRYGFHTNTSTKPMIISGLVRAVREGSWVERDERCIEELLNYERKPNGSYGAIAGQHDDLLMTRAIGLHVCFHEMGVPRSYERAERKMRKKKGSGGAAQM